MLNRKSYFQGTEEPTPKKKKYKSEPALVMQPRFKEPLFHNYDAYDVPGVNDSPSHGPGTGWNSMHEYKSVSEFLKARRERSRTKYKSDDSYIQDDGTITKNKKASVKIRLLQALTKTAIDFQVDDQINSDPILGDSGSVADSVYFGGQTDEYLANPDFEGKSEDTLNFGRDYDDNKVSKNINMKNINDLMNKYLSSIDGLFGLPDGVNLPEDEQPTPTNINPYYGTTNVGITSYEDKWNV